jgi:hypothetical protein
LPNLLQVCPTSSPAARKTTHSTKAQTLAGRAANFPFLMKQILRFSIDVRPEQLKVLPIFTTVIAFRWQYGNPVIWAECETPEYNEERKVIMYQDGDPLVHHPALFDYLGLVFMGDLALHFYISKANAAINLSHPNGLLPSSSSEQ